MRHWLPLATTETTNAAAAEALSAYDNKFVAIDRRFDAHEARMDQRFSGLEHRFEQKLERLRADLELRIEHLAGRATFQQWQLALLMGGVASLVIKAFFTGSQ